MFEFDAGKLVIIGIVALIVIGPKELPRVMRQVGQAVAKLRRLSADFQAQFMEAMREADLAEIKAEAAKISEAARLDAGMDPLAGIRAELTKSLEATPLTESSDVPLATHTEPLAESLREDQQASLRAIECRTAAPAGLAVPAEAAAPEPVAETSAPELAPEAAEKIAQDVASEPAPPEDQPLAAEPLRKRG